MVLYQRREFNFAELAMMLEGKLARPKGSKFWEIEVPLLEVYTQGRSRKDALAMIKEAIELVADRKGFEVELVPAGDSFKVRANDTRALIGLVLERQRQVRRTPPSQ